jgi:hypothetical protein
MAKRKDLNARGFALMAERLRPLAEFYKKYQARRMTMVVIYEDYEQLKLSPRIAEHYGFSIDDNGRPNFMGFELMPDRKPRTSKPLADIAQTNAEARSAPISIDPSQGEGVHTSDGTESVCSGE